jgi:glycosyltransferase involved in cell wall biosynthesis
MKKVLLIGPDFHGYNISYKNILEKNGFSVKEIPSNMDVCDSNIIVRGFCRINKKYEIKYLDKLKHGFDKMISNQYLIYHPDYVLILKGNMLYPETIQKMRKHSIVSLVTTDSLDNTEGGLDIARVVDFCYVFEGTDVKKYQAVVPNIQFMPIGYDDEVYHPVSCKKDIDISFVGAGDKKRLFILKSLIRDFPDRNMKFYGMGVSHVFFWKYIAFRLSKESRYIIPHGLTPEEINILYSRSKICLNINKDQSIEGWNPRTNEILGAGGFELVSENIAIKSEFKGCLAMYNNYDDLKEKIIYYLSNEEERNNMAKQGYNLVREKHTFKKRVQRIINDWENAYKS